MDYSEFEAKISSMNDVDNLEEVKYIPEENSVIFRIKINDDSIKSKIKNLSDVVIEETNTCILVKKFS